MRKLLDSISTITWLCMDIFWMYDIYIGAIIFMLLTYIGIMTHIMMSAVNGPLTLNDKLVHLATIFWVSMNSMWMLSDYYPHVGFEISKTMAMIAGITTVITLAVKDAQRLNSVRRFNK